MREGFEINLTFSAVGLKNITYLICNETGSGSQTEMRLVQEKFMLLTFSLLWRPESSEQLSIGSDHY